MVTLDQLLAEKRAILELLLRRWYSYDELSELLHIPSAKVREIARNALIELAPATAEHVDAELRSQVADYMLRQQTVQEAMATRANMRRSEPARAWARSLVDLLDALYDDAPPDIPGGRRGIRPDRRWIEWLRRRAEAVGVQRRNGGFRRPSHRRRPVSTEGRCAVCSSTGPEPGEQTADAFGWRVSGEVRLCPACQSRGWQLPEGARLPHLPPGGGS